MSSLLILLLLLIVAQLASALFLWLGAKWAKIPKATLWRALGATFVIWLVSHSLHLGLIWLGSVARVPPLLGAGFEFVVDLFVMVLTVRLLFRTSFGRALVSLLPTIVPAAAVVAFIFLVLSPYILGAYYAPTHSMAPTLLGPHLQGPCPHCGQLATVSYHASTDFMMQSMRNELGICPSCQQTGVVVNLASKVHPSDRFLVNKLLTPQRWDIVAHRSLQDPKMLYVKRLIGLPGEKVLIKEGGIWINEEKQQPPADIAKLTFSPNTEMGRPGWGSLERPIQLGEGEYFVIGDFCLRSSDSRDWGALPGRNIEGVVSVIYWPPSRSRIIR